MKITRIVTLVTVLLAAFAMAAPVSASEVLYDGSGLLRGQQSFTDTMLLDGPGTLTVTLTNVNWPVQLASLNLIVTSPLGLLGPEMGAGTQSFEIAGGAVTLQWFGLAQGALATGSYSL